MGVVEPFYYIHMLWALIYGYWLWGYLPGVETWIGSAVLVMSGLYIIFDEKRAMARREKVVDPAH